MTTKTTWAALAGAAAGLTALCTAAPVSAAPGSAQCHMRKLAELPITMEGLRPVVQVKVNGKDVSLVLDTGAFHSMLTPATAASTKIKADPMGDVVTGGVTGMSNNSTGTAVLTLAKVPIPRVQFLIGGSDLEERHGGLLGQNVFSLFDVEYDLANGVVRIFDPKGCAGADLGYWADGASVIPIEPITDESLGIIGHAKVNGHNIRFAIDTGSSASVLTLAAAKRAGMPTSGDGVIAAGGVSGLGGGWAETWIAPASFEIGYESLAKTRLRFGKLELGEDMLLGDDFMLSHRVLVSNVQHKMYFTYNGGPVFQLKTSSSVGEGKPPAEGATAAAADGLNAEALTRRGDASLARGDARAAISDLTRAITAEPTAKRLLDRANAYAMNGQGKESLADLDAALKLEPDDTDALLARGSQFLANHEDARAEADFERAKKASATSVTFSLQVARRYEEEDRPRKAIAELDAWLAAHAGDNRVPAVMADRCRVRAMWGQELDKALDDCSAALKKTGKVAEILQARGTANLRLKRYREAAADFDAALKLQSRSAWSLYGRGLTKQGLGDAAGGAADIKAALEIKPNLKDDLTRHGIIAADPGAGDKPSPASH